MTTIILISAFSTNNHLKGTSHGTHIVINDHECYNSFYTSSYCIQM